MGRKKLPNPKGNNYKRPCADCQEPCFGHRCRSCAFAAMPITVRMGAANRSLPRTVKVIEPVVIANAVPPGSSWWTERDFGAAFQRELPQLMAIKVSGNPGYVNTVLD